MSDRKEYIERGALLQDIEESIVFSCRTGYISAEVRGATAVKARIHIAPAADVVEVVFCSQCKYYQDNNGGYPHEECRWGHEETPNPDDYCSYGVRKDGAE